MEFVPPVSYNHNPYRNPRRNLTVPIPSTTNKPIAPQPISAPAEQVIHRRHVKNKSIQSIGSSRSIPLQAEIQRLTTACDEHERRIRAIKGSIKHKLFTEMPLWLDEFTRLDQSAEQITGNLHHTIQSTLPPLRNRLAKLTEERKADLETMRRRTTPWQGLFDGEEDGSNSQGKRRIQRIDGSGVSQGDGLEKIERWAEETEMLLNAEIIRLKSEIASKTTTSRRLWRLLVYGSAALVFVLMGIIVLSRVL